MVLLCSLQSQRGDAADVFEGRGRRLGESREKREKEGQAHARKCSACDAGLAATSTELAEMPTLQE